MGGFKMTCDFYITENEKSWLRELAKKYVDYSMLPIMEERKKLWYAHNSLKADRPVVVMEMETFQGDILPKLKCESVAAKMIEHQLLMKIINHELIDDDKVIPPYFTVMWNISCMQFGMNIEKEFAKDSKGRTIGYSQHHPIIDLKDDFYKIGPSLFNVDKEHTLAWKNFVEEIIGDILPIKIKNDSLIWHFAPTAKVVDLMGLETMMYSMVDYPDEMHALFKFIKEDMINFIQWQEKEQLLILNNENDYAGAGSYGFTNELPSTEFQMSGVVTPKDLWGNMNSQESIGISPDMYGEYIFPYYYELARQFGLVYYGCCEPVHNIWEKYISKLPGLRKVSVSPWCDENFMGSALKGSNVIYSRKPSPNFVGVGSFNEQGFREHMATTLKAANGCHLEIIFRDVYNLSGEKEKPGKAVKITRELIDRLW